MWTWLRHPIAVGVLFFVVAIAPLWIGWWWTRRRQRLERQMWAMERGTREPTRILPAPATHPRVDIKQWTVRLSQVLIEAVKAEAAAEGKEPSHLVEEVLWQALTDRGLSTS